MKHCSHNHLLTTLLLLAIAVTASAKLKLRSLDIEVVLAKNGDARITEVRQMDIDDEGTECYILMSHLDGRRVRDVSVSDESGQRYEFIGEWDIDASRRQKAAKCGLVEKDDGYELCWGLGSEGQRTYTTSYTLTRLLRGYDDADGFNYMFVSMNMKPRAEFARVTIRREDGQPFTDDETNIWGFRFDGDVQFHNGAIVAQTDNALEKDQGIIIMVEVEKGVFDPAKNIDGSFEEVKERAFDGSDYAIDENGEEDMKWWEVVLGILFILAYPVIFIVNFVRRWRERRRINQDLTWYRDIPFNGNLKKANEMMNSLRYFSKKYDNLLNAIVMRLISIGAIDIVSVSDKRGRTSQQLAINELDAEGQKQQSLVRKVHAILLKASGDDRILQPKELKKWVRRNAYNLEGFITDLKSSAKLKDVMNEREKVRQLYGLRMFLKDFTLANERHATEVKLWNEYLVWATLFGMAKQVSADMKKLNPDLASINKQLELMNDEHVVPVISAALLRSTHRAERAIAARNSGSGGSASSGGGGGFSGGGSGGGVR